MASISQTAGVRPALSVSGRGGLVDRYFYLSMGFVTAGVVYAGFSQTVGMNLFHAAVPRPLILWFHGAAFSSWVLFFILQSALVRTRNVRVHRALGWFGAALGTAMVVLGFTTSVIMTRFDMRVLHEVTGTAEFLVIPFYDMIAFGTLFGLAILWRKKPDLHRRLLFLATVGLLDAAFGRFQYLFDSNLFAVCVWGVMLLGPIRDWIVDKRVHRLYLIALPCVIVAFSFALYTWRSASPWWMSIAHSLLG